MGIDGDVAALALWDDAEDLDVLFDPGRRASMPFKVIGEGSNLLFVDSCFDGIILQCGNKSTEIIHRDGDTVRVHVAAGCRLDDLVSWSVGNGLWGLENLALIPGTVGAAAVQNVGAYGREFGDLVARVHCYNTHSRCKMLMGHSRLGYGYRESAFKHAPFRDKVIITGVEIELSVKPRPCLAYGNLEEKFGGSGASLTASVIRDEIVATRMGKLPDVKEVGSAGSFFKNPIVGIGECESFLRLAAERGYDPEKIPAHHVLDIDGKEACKLSAAWLVDKSGFKGVTNGNVGTWPSQPLVIVNATGRATGREVKEFAHAIVEEVRKQWGIGLTPEVEYINNPRQ